MFSNNQSVEALSKQAYKEKVLPLRASLMKLQQQVSNSGRPVIIVIAGNDRSGRHETINALCEWMDVRYLKVNAYGPSQSADEAHPFFWRFWRDLPGNGEIAIYLRDWTSTSLVQHLNGEFGNKKLKKREKYIRDFEKKHTDAGALIIKCWLHVSEAELKKRIKATRDTPYYDDKDALALIHYDSAMSTFEQTLKATSVEGNEWHIINGKHELNRNIEVGELIRSKIEDWLTASPQKVSKLVYEKPSKDLKSIAMVGSDQNSLKGIDTKNRVSDDKLKKQLVTLQAKIRAAMFKLQKKKIPIVIAFEGWDAAGKGGAIRRLVAPLDAGFYRVEPIAAPTDEEKAHHYLWRFWKRMPRDGHMTVFDRSWYGRVLVERVEGFAKEVEWHNAYQEIIDFEEQLTLHGAVLVKVWLNISKEEQLRRFEQRKIIEHKKHKITEEDWRNRERWDDYVEAIDDMIAKTSTKNAPWSVISTDNKHEARVEVLNSVLKAIKKRLD